MTTLPAHILNYRVSASSPTDELLTLGRIFSEVGSYMSTILDRDHLSLARKCSTRLKKVVEELKSRKRIQSADDLYSTALSDQSDSSDLSDLSDQSDQSDLSALSISDLYNLYLGWPARHRQRRRLGREPLTFYYEGHIVREMLSRKPTDKGEQLKIDYCVAAYNNELDNLSSILSLPVNLGNPQVYPDPEKAYSKEELADLIARYTPYRDITERELLIEYTDLQSAAESRLSRYITT